VSIYQHFRTEEHPFIDQVLSWRHKVENTYIQKLTDFLDPREQQIVEAVIGSNNDIISFRFHGGNKSCERKRALIAPFYEEFTTEAFQLSLLEATFNDKFLSIDHRDVMGAFLSLGLERKKLGDIIIGKGVFQLIVAKEIRSYVILNLTMVKKAHVRLKEKPLTAILPRQMNWQQRECVVSSLRLDVVLKAMYKLSRQEAEQMIKKKQVKVNFKIVDDIAYYLQPGDLISTRQKGRGKLIQVGSRTRKNNLKITLAQLK